ncbi:oligosaccharide flippase family protein [Vibrio maritimus]
MAIFRDSILYIAGEVLSKVLPFLIIPYLSRSLGPEGLGELSYIITIVSITQIVVSFGFGNAILRYYYTKGKHSIGLLAQAGFIHASFVAVIIWLMLSPFFEPIVALLITGVSYFSGLVMMLIPIIQCHRKPKYYVLVQAMLSIVMTLTTIMLFEWVSSSVESRLLSMVIGNFVGFALLTYLLLKLIRFKHFNFQISYASWRYMFVLGLPLFFHQLFGVGKVHVERMLIYGAYSASDLGIYFSSWQVASVVQVLLMTISKAVTPYLYEALRDSVISNYQVVKLSFLALVVGVLIALPVMLFPSTWYVWLLGDGFEGSAHFVPIFVLSMTIMLPYYVVGSLLMYHGDNTKLTMITLVASSIHILLTLAMISQSIIALAWVSVASNSILAVNLVVYGHFKYKN